MSQTGGALLQAETSTSAGDMRQARATVGSGGSTMGGKPASDPAFDADAAALAAKDDPPPPDPKDIVGDAACAGCHPAQTRKLHATYHAQTLQLEDTTHPGKSMPPTGQVADSGYVVVQEGKRLYFTQDGQIAHGQPIQYAVGAGKNGVTYVRVFGAQKLLAMRMSYFPTIKKWYPTPGAKLNIDHYVGDLTQGDTASRCLACHAVKVDKSTGTVPAGFLGVGCESCHGAGRAHVAAMKSGNMADIHMERLKTWSARRLNRMCGQCHGNGDGFRPDDAGTTSTTNRFMSYGLMRSRCFVEGSEGKGSEGKGSEGKGSEGKGSEGKGSEGKGSEGVEGVKGAGGADGNKRISCITCHDSHTDAITNNAYYEARCLSCHSGNNDHSGNKDGAVAPISTTGSDANAVPVSARKPAQIALGSPGGGKVVHVNTVCKVNPRSGCVGCHMPRREAIPGLRLPVEMADHYIRIHRDPVWAGGTH